MSKRRRKLDHSDRHNLTWKRLAGTCFLAKCVCTWSTACFEKGFWERKRKISNSWKRQKLHLTSTALLVFSAHENYTHTSERAAAASPTYMTANCGDRPGKIIILKREGRRGEDEEEGGEDKRAAWCSVNTLMKSPIDGDRSRDSSRRGLFSSRLLLLGAEWTF